MGPAAPLRPGILTSGGPAEMPLDASPVRRRLHLLYTENRTHNIAGSEDHGVAAHGISNLDAYDDSNLFVAATARSTPTPANRLGRPRRRRHRPLPVSAGPHCDDGWTTKTSSPPV